MIDGNDRAFPDAPFQRETGGNVEPSGAYFDPGGLTKREWFAGLAMQALIGRWMDSGQTLSDIVSRQSVEYADALITALNEKQAALDAARTLSKP